MLFFYLLFSHIMQEMFTAKNDFEQVVFKYLIMI